MFVSNNHAPPPPYHATPTNGHLDRTAPPSLPYYQPATQSQPSIDMIDNQHVNSSVLPTPITNQSGASDMMNGSGSLRPQFMLDQSVTPQVSLPPHHSNNLTMTPGLSDSTVPLPPYSFNQSAMTPGTFAARRLLPAHLVDQSTVMFPNLSASRIYPPEEAALNDIVQRMNEAYPANLQGKHLQFQGSNTYLQKCSFSAQSALTITILHLLCRHQNACTSCVFSYCNRNGQ